MARIRPFAAGARRTRRKPAHPVGIQHGTWLGDRHAYLVAVVVALIDFACARLVHNEDALPAPGAPAPEAALA